MRLAEGEHWNIGPRGPDDTFSLALFAIDGVRGWGMSAMDRDVVEVALDPWSEEAESAIRRICGPRSVLVTPDPFTFE